MVIMPNVYLINESRTTEAMERVHCKDEIRELQDILEHNYDLLPGDQINPEDPCRWMLIKREMPVPDPSSGTPRWSVDFFFVDQSAMPTFVECKLFKSTESRRKIVGQVLEYAANGPYLWSKDIIRDYAQKSAEKSKSALEDALRALEPDEADSVESFFDRVEENLREGQIRIVFFLEEAPNELKCLVEFLNRQTVSTEVLLVEARQYKQGDIRVVVPTLFGFTEQARRIKQTVKPRDVRTWDWDSFNADARTKGLDNTAIGAIRKVYDCCVSLSAKIDWGGGRFTGSFNAKWPDICSASVLSVYSNGYLAFGFGNLGTSEVAQSFRDKLKEMVVRRLDLPVPENFEKKFPQYAIADWGLKADLLVESLKHLVTQALAHRNVMQRAQGDVG
jgi:hypothetical protein